MKFRQPESQAAAAPVTMSTPRTGKSMRLSAAHHAHRDGEPIWTPEFQVAPPIAVLQLVTGHWVSQIVGVAAELGLADEIQNGPRTAQEVAAAKGLHVDAVYRLLRALASVGIFADAMDGYAVLGGTAVVEAYDFSRIQTLAEIGGNLVLAIVLAKYPLMRGIIFDLPAVIESLSGFLRSHHLENRVELRCGNFLEAAPEGADAYLLQNIPHWQSDEDCLRVLKAIHAAAKPDAKLLIVEAIIETSNEPQFAKTLDIAMLVLGGGKERTLGEWEELLSAAGFRITRTIPTGSFASVIEAIRS
jgi:hypothetical protein